MDHIAVEITFFIVMLAGVVVMIFGIPGNLIAVIVALLYWIFSDRGTITPGLFFLILGGSGLLAGCRLFFFKTLFINKENST